jgi:hypothetical protein|tara:strand:- start:533 stop:802 length:270 start_codon:yes stop_codon:yes gene_type:complete
MTTKKTEIVITDTAIDAQRDLVQKLGSKRWEVIRLVQDVGLDLTLENCLEDPFVYLCHEVVKRDKPYQIALERLRELTPCTCHEHEDND